jgi:hypothetical protein
MQEQSRASQVVIGESFVTVHDPEAPFSGVRYVGN